MERPPIPEPPHTGGCLCGKTRYALEAQPLGVNACHCDQCKKLSGTTNLLMLIAARASFAHLSGEVLRFRKTAESGREIDIVRCVECGVRLWHEPLSAPDFLFIAAGTLDDTGWAVPTSHIWTEKAAPGVTFHDDALCVEGQPLDRQTLMDAFRRVYGDGE